MFAGPRVASIRTFLKRMPQALIFDAIDISSKIPASMSYDEKRWRYFCGVCWAKIREAEGQ